MLSLNCGSLCIERTGYNRIAQKCFSIPAEVEMHSVWVELACNISVLKVVNDAWSLKFERNDPRSGHEGVGV